MANVYYSCPFVPTELIAACGHTPCRPEPAPHPASAAAETEGLCAWAAAFVESLAQHTDPAAAVFTTACDQMRRACELYAEMSGRPAFLLNVPKTDGTTALAMLSKEFERLEQFLARLDGGMFCRSRLAQPTEDTKTQYSAPAHNGLAVVGGPLFEADAERLRQAVERFGAKIVFDGTESAWRRFRIPCDHSRQTEAPLQALAQSYLSTPAIWKRPGKPFFDWLDKQIKTHCVNGVIVIQHPFCDYWRAAAYDIKNRLNVPVVTLETGEGGRFCAAALSRLDAFLEHVER